MIPEIEGLLQTIALLQLGQLLLLLLMEVTLFAMWFSTKEINIEITERGDDECDECGDDPDEFDPGEQWK